MLCPFSIPFPTTFTLDCSLLISSDKLLFSLVFEEGRLRNKAVFRRFPFIFVWLGRTVLDLGQLKNALDLNFE